MVEGTHSINSQDTIFGTTGKNGVTLGFSVEMSMHKMWIKDKSFSKVRLDDRNVQNII